jgi:hypothetical protein
MHDNELQMGVSSHDPANELHIRLDSLLTRMGPEAPSTGSQIPMNAEPPSSSVEPRTFMLVLDARTPIHGLYPDLLSHLDSLRQRSYLTHWDGAEVVQGPVTVVVTGDSVPSSDCSNHPYSDVFLYSKGGISQDDVTNDRLTPICVV